jgi:photosystem II stability/assembly factor-like uncharacterized protein
MTRRAPAMVSFLVAAAALAATSCKTKGGGGSGGGSTSSGSSWLVGVAGTMIRLNHKELRDLGEYELPVVSDLFGIACRGEREAWVAGAQGTILHSSDGGATWQVVPSGVTDALRSVAVAYEGGVYVAGDGVLLFTADAGVRWRRVSAGATSFTGVATTATGDLALLTAADGSLWRYQASQDRLAPVVRGSGGALRSVAIRADGGVAVAVGAQGLFLISEDGGRSFRARPAGTTRTLHDVWLFQAGERAIAVGEAGVIVEVTVSGQADARVEELLPPSAALRSLHLSADGSGLAVGDRGAAFVTADAGRTWTPVDVDTTATLHGVDALHGEPHL